MDYPTIMRTSGLLPPSHPTRIAIVCLHRDYALMRQSGAPRESLTVSLHRGVLWALFPTLTTGEA